MAKKETNYYFDTFSKGITYSNDAAALLEESFEDFNPDNLKLDIEKMHKIEHAADELKHDMMQRLMKEFLPPLEREDIVELAHTIDDVTDNIEDVLLKIYMLNINTLRPEVKEFSHLISCCCQTLKRVAEELPNYRKSTVIRNMIVEINGLEEKGDRLYADAMRRLYTEAGDAVNILAWTTVFDRLEKCCDSCEHVGDMVERVIMKNS